MYNKLFTKILDSSIWMESADTRLVWLTFIAAMDSTGFAQFASCVNVAHRARVSIEGAAEAIRVLEAPDPNSGDQSNEGRRLEKVPGGWMVLNAKKYRDIVTAANNRELNRIRVENFRKRKKADQAPSDAKVTANDIDSILNAFQNAWVEKFPPSSWHFDGILRKKLPNLEPADIEPIKHAFDAHVSKLEATKFFNPEKFCATWRAYLEA